MMQCSWLEHYFEDDFVESSGKVRCVFLSILQDEKPWVAVKTDRELCGALISAALGLVLVLAAVIEPYMPATAEKVFAPCTRMATWNGMQYLVYNEA